MGNEKSEPAAFIAVYRKSDIYAKKQFTNLPLWQHLVRLLTAKR